MTELTQFIIQCLHAYYLVEVTTLTQLPLGADINASIYKAQTRDQKTYFVKLKRDSVQNVPIAILDLLQKAGIQELIPPIKTVEGRQIQQVGDLTFIVYPFIQGQDGFSQPLTEHQWIILGRALRQVHEVVVPTYLIKQIRREEFSPKWRNAVRSLYDPTETILNSDEIALNMRQFLKEKRSLILKLVDRSELISQKICHRPLKFVLCHSDIHAGNVLINGTESLYIVDWDDPIVAPKERDLMFIGGGVNNIWNQPWEEKLFYQGYGQTDIDWTLLTYYRYERIVEDIAVYSQELLYGPLEEKNRPEMLKQFMDLFSPQGVVDIAFATDQRIIE